jgi:hypothetical protein
MVNIFSEARSAGEALANADAWNAGPLAPLCTPPRPDRSEEFWALVCRPGSLHTDIDQMKASFEDGYRFAILNLCNPDELHF